VARTVICEPAQYCRSLNDCVDRHRNDALASAAWQEFQSATPGTVYSPAYSDGFTYGFADYLYAGGTGEPPPVPPRYYWRSEFESPGGQEVMADWFKGYRVGAAQAWGTGLRRVITVLTSDPLPQRPPLPPVPPPGPPNGTPPANKANGKPEVLPAPREGPPQRKGPLPPADADKGPAPAPPMPEPIVIPMPPGEARGGATSMPLPPFTTSRPQGSPAPRWE
jgi:hypothetical protein